MGVPEVLGDLIPTAADWSDWDGIMVTTHFGPVAGLSWATRDTKKARFGSKCLLGPKRAQIGPNFKIVANL